MLKHPSGPFISGLHLPVQTLPSCPLLWLASHALASSKTCCHHLGSLSQHSWPTSNCPAPALRRLVGRSLLEKVDSSPCSLIKCSVYEASCPRFLVVDPHLSPSCSKSCLNPKPEVHFLVTHPPATKLISWAREEPLCCYSSHPVV